MQQPDYRQLADAAQRLEKTSLIEQISHIAGMPVEKAMLKLPQHWSVMVNNVTRNGLEKAMDSALLSLNPTNKNANPHNKTHQVVAAVTGGVGGGFGLAALALELPTSTTIMLRSIAEIARSNGEDLNALDTKMACLSVFALTGDKAIRGQDHTETGYYAVRSFLSKSISDSARHITLRGLSQDGAPGLIKLLGSVSSRFSIPVSEKLAVQALPVIGAFSGASINLLFMQHYQAMAEAHFTVRRLERLYGKTEVKKSYQEIVRCEFNESSM